MNEFNFSSSYLVPAKVMLFGEYSSLIYGKAILHLLSDKNFKLDCTKSELNDSLKLSGIHIESPKKNESVFKNFNLKFYDPFLEAYNSSIGVGASTAQFLSLYLLYCDLKKIQKNEKELLNFYFECFNSQDSLLPSGMDLLSQYWGVKNFFGESVEGQNQEEGLTNKKTDKNFLENLGVLSAEGLKQDLVFIEKKEDKVVYKNLGSLKDKFKEHNLFLYFLGFKQKTHEHLKVLRQNNFLEKFKKELEVLNELTLSFLNALQTGSEDEMIFLINQYQDELFKFNFKDCTFFYETILNLKKESSVKAVKGLGSQGGDCLLVVTSKDFDLKNYVSNSAVVIKLNAY